MGFLARVRWVESGLSKCSTQDGISGGRIGALCRRETRGLGLYFGFPLGCLKATRDKTGGAWCCIIFPFQGK